MIIFCKFDDAVVELRSINIQKKNFQTLINLSNIKYTSLLLIYFKLGIKLNHGRGQSRISILCIKINYKLRNNHQIIRYCYLYDFTNHIRYVLIILEENIDEQ